MLDQLPFDTHLDHVLFLNLKGCNVCVQTNEPELIDVLQRYFSDVPQQAVPDALPIRVVQSNPLELNASWVDWAREAGKKGRKDAYVDCDITSRIIRKVKTGMVFFQSLTECLAAGPAVQNQSQIINFILSQAMTRLQWNGGLICHAAAVTVHGESLVLAGFSGKGKSTLMLRQLERAGVAFTSNDRVFVQNGKAFGIPKMPRINPGTVLGNSRLHGLLTPEKRNYYSTLTMQDLWPIEDKVDVPVTSLYGPEKVKWGGRLNGLVLLNWQFDCNDATQLRQINLAEREDLLPAVMKSPGPFFQSETGKFLKQPDIPSTSRYIQTFSGSAVYELSGRIDFEKACRLISETMGWSSREHESS
ncbi:MAG: HprK-related kinase B [Limnobacter sp.]|nr:HprK-related kinase B [Limnobacter sp.]